MRFISYLKGQDEGLAILDAGGEWRGLTSRATGFPGTLEALIGQGAGSLQRASAALASGEPVDLKAVVLLPPLQRPPKIICVGLNYADHTKESKIAQPTYPTLFTRFATTLIGGGQPIVCPRDSEQLDYEGELVAVIGTGGRYIDPSRALDHVAGWSIFNDVSVRDYQFRTPQWTIGKNFDATGPFGPMLVTPDELPRGAAGLRLETRLNGVTVQSARTDEMIFDVATLIATISEAMTLEPGDVLVTGTPSGVGFARKPPLWMKDGDWVDVEIEGIGVLSNPVKKAAAA